MRIELFGPTPAVAQFVTSLPLRGEDLNLVGLDAVPGRQTVFFAGRILARKHSPEHPEDVLLELTVSGWVVAAGGPSE